MSDRTSRRKVACVALAGLMAVPAIAVVATAAGAARPTDRVYVERRWDSLANAQSAQHVRLALDTVHRTAYTFASTSAGLAVAAHDLDRLTPRGPAIVEPGMPLLLPSTPIAVDERNGVVVYAPKPSGASAVPGVHLYRATSGVTRLGAPVTRFPAGYAVLGMAVDAPRGRLFVLGAPSLDGQVKQVGAGVGRVQLDSWRLTDLAAGRIASDLAAPLVVPAACGQVVSNYFPAGILPSPDGRSVHFGCLSHRGYVTILGPNAGDLGGVARLDLAAAAAGEASALRISPISGNYAEGDSFAIPGAQRMLLAAANSASATVKVYDAVKGYYVGNVGLDDGIKAFGFDFERGRAYYLNGAGLGLFDAAKTPVNQGVTYAEYKNLFGLLQRGIDVDARTRRVFIVTADDLTGGTKPYFVVLKDPTQVEAGLEPEDDGDGLDVDEVPGKFESSRVVDAGALGAEYRMVGGPSNLIYNTAHFDSRGILTRPGTRTMQNAAVRALRMTPDEASVGVVTMRYDDITASDANNTHLSEPLECTDFGAGLDEKKRLDSQVVCDTAKQHAEGNVVAEPGRVLMTHATADDPIPAAAYARHATSSVDTVRAEDGAVVTTLHAEATGIDILGAVQIGRVAVDAQVRLKGRPGTASTAYNRTIEGLVVDGNKVCDDCPVETVGAAIEEAFGGRVLVYLPEPERYVSPRGTRAFIRDNLHRHFQRMAFDEVPADSFVTPALEVVVYLDGTSPSRFIASFASVSAQASYKIRRVGFDEPLPGTEPPGAPPSLGPVIDGGTGTTDDGVVGGVDGPTKPTTIAAPQAQGDVVQRLTQGLKVVFRSPRHLAAVIALWSLLALPTYLAARRRLLLDLPFLRPVEES